MKSNIAVKRILRAAFVAAIYTVLAIVLAPASTAPVQIRISEALTLLPVLFPESVVGVTVGCFVTNLILSAPLDVAVGTVTTLMAALLTRRLRHMRFKKFALIPSLPPILLNAVFVGAELTVIYYPPGTPVSVWLLNMAAVCLGQLISCGAAGVLLVYALEKHPAFRRLSDA